MVSTTTIVSLMITLVLVTESRAQGTCLCRLTREVCRGRDIACTGSSTCPCTSNTGDTCPNGQTVNCVTPGGTGDPKFTAFDGSTFYFHGLHSNRYVIHAANHGETLVAKMRATNELWMGINRTYFEQFGLNVPTTNTKLRFFLTRDLEASGWRLGTEVNGKSFSSDSSATLSPSIEIVQSQGKVVVTTPLTQ